MDMGPTGHRDPLASDIWWLLKYVLSAQAGGTHPIGMLSGIFVIHSSSEFLCGIWSNELALLIKSLIVLGTLRWGRGADAKLKLAYLPCKILLYFVDNISTCIPQPNCGSSKLFINNLNVFIVIACD